MKKHLSHIIILLSFLFANAQQEKAFYFKDQNKSATLELENKATALTLNEKTTFTVYTENIDLKQSVIIGRGIRILGNDAKSSVSCCVIVDAQSVVNGFYKISFGYTVDDERKWFVFLIPVKE